jgi:hypothetical protein
MGEKLTRRKVLLKASAGVLALAMSNSLLSGGSAQAQDGVIVVPPMDSHPFLKCFHRHWKECQEADFVYHECMIAANGNRVQQLICAAQWLAEVNAAEARMQLCILTNATWAIGDIMIMAEIWCLENPGQCVLGVVISIAGVILILTGNGWIVATAATATAAAN